MKRKNSDVKDIDRRTLKAVCAGVLAGMIGLAVGFSAVFLASRLLERAFGPFGDFSWFYFSTCGTVVVVVFGAVALGVFIYDRLCPSSPTADGCCPSCGYDLRSDFTHGCPECGWNRDSGQS